MVKLGGTSQSTGNDEHQLNRVVVYLTDQERASRTGPDGAYYDEPA